jgi:hypothetical protein
VAKVVQILPIIYYIVIMGQYGMIQL